MPKQERGMMTMPNSEKLKPCPFCGGKNIKYTNAANGIKNNHAVFCEDCGGGKGYFSGSSPDTIIKEFAENAWNRRADDGKRDF